MLAHRRRDREAHAGGVERRVVGDLRPGEHEAHPAVRQVEAARHLGVPLVRAVPDPREAAEPLRRVVEIVVRALVVVRFAGVLVHEIVGVEADQSDVAHGRTMPQPSRRRQRVPPRTTGRPSPCVRYPRMAAPLVYSPFAYEIHDDPYPTYARTPDEAPAYHNP